MHEIYQLKSMISALQPNYATKYQYNSYAQVPPQQPLVQHSIYPVNLNHYEQSSYGSQNQHQPVSNNFQPTYIPQHLTTANSPLDIKTTLFAANQPTTFPTLTESKNISMLKNGQLKPIQMSELKATTASSITEKILEFKPVQTKSLNRSKSKHYK